MPTIDDYRKVFNKYWSGFYKGNVFDTLVDLGLTQAQMRAILTKMKNDRIAELQRKKTEADSEILELENEVIS